MPFFALWRDSARTLVAKIGGPATGCILYLIIFVLTFVSKNFERPSNLKDDMESKEPLDQRYKAGNCNLQNLK